MQPAPTGLPQPAKTAATPPMMPPMQAPQPSWKSEVKQETPAPEPGKGTPPGGDQS
jgi:hypothetical protein